MHAIPADLTALTGIRFIAAFWVVLFHFREEILRVAPKMSWLSSLLSHGHQAVPFFFMLSGFILSHSYFPRYRAQSHFQFVVLRFARLWPVHLATILFLVAYKSAFAVARGHAVTETSY